MSPRYHPGGIGRALAGEHSAWRTSGLRMRGELRRHRNLFLTPTTINSFPLIHCMADISPSIDTRRIVRKKPIRILALDGGGIRGLLSLIFPRGLME